jgi:predicted negative regulator of RcsB-dependent stress response
VEPNHAKAMLMKGEVLFSLGRWKQAIEAFETACTYLTMR